MNISLSGSKHGKGESDGQDLQILGRMTMGLSGLTIDSSSCVFMCSCLGFGVGAVNGWSECPLISKVEFRRALADGSAVKLERDIFLSRSQAAKKPAATA